MNRSTVLVLTGVMTVLLSACGGSPKPSGPVPTTTTSETKTIETPATQEPSTATESPKPDEHADASDVMDESTPAGADSSISQPPVGDSATPDQMMSPPEANPADGAS